MKKTFKTKREAFAYAMHESFENLDYAESCTEVSCKLECKIRYFKGRDEWEVEVPFTCR